MERHTALTALALELVTDKCTCELVTPSGMVGFRPASRKTYTYRTPRSSFTCTRCRVRRALEADGVLEPEPPMDRGGL